MKQITTTSEKQTYNFAKKFAKQLKGGEVIGLIGELGAGKTIFAKGLAAGLGIKKNITSPTFVLMKIYPTTNYKLSPPHRDPAVAGQIINFVHIDAYRIKSPQDITAIGAEEYFNRPDVVTIIEWADKISPALSNKKCGTRKILPKKTKFIKIINKGGNKRKFIIN